MRFAVGICLSLLTLGSAGGAEPKVAVWDPETKSTEPRISFDPAVIRASVAGLKSAGIEAQLLIAERIAADDFPGASAYDALVIASESFPEIIIPAIRRFADEGGVVIAIGQGVPLLNKIVSGSDRGWRLSPGKPKFAWQTGALYGHLGLTYKYKPQYHDMGVRHRPSSVLHRFAPELPELLERPPVAWAPPRKGVKLYPLIRSFRTDGLEVPGLLYVLENGRRRSIICTAPKLLLGTDPKVWPQARRTFAAVCELARRLHAKENLFGDGDALKVVENPPVEKVMPLSRTAESSVNPEGAEPIVRWGRFDGSCLDLSEGHRRDRELPRALAPGESVTLDLPSEVRSGAAYLRVRGAYVSTGAGLKASIGGKSVLHEVFLGEGTDTAGNFSASFKGEAFQFTRVVPIPLALRSSGERLVLTNPGWRTLFFDAVQVERPAPPRRRAIGLGQPNPQTRLGSVEKRNWGPLRSTIRMSEALPNGTDRFHGPEEWCRSIRLDEPSLAYEGLIERCPEWLAESQERLMLAKNAGRPMWVKPRAREFADLCAEFVAKHSKEYERFEIWNECDIQQFWRGTADEYADLYKQTEAAILKVAPQTKVMPAGLAGFHPDFIDRLVKSGVYAKTDLVPMHAYAGQSAYWDLAYGRVEGFFMSRGIGTEIYPNESGFPSCNMEWFQAPPDWTPERQAECLNVALSRLLANAVSRASVFTAGGTAHGYGLVDAAGVPKPAYAVWSDYSRLNGNGSIRLDAVLLRTDGAPIAGVYVAGARFVDGSCLFVINPSECDVSRPIDIELRWMSADGSDRTKMLTVSARTVIEARSGER